ncbi:hypothetical protein ACGFNV_00225 [Streptomyces sp. NPDC048751]|uniref:hypothetical protein n=1 Tax=Streptomyces sp. NPDC048751 TaxID=3365591 RepID=UPI00371AD129
MSGPPSGHAAVRIFLDGLGGTAELCRGPGAPVQDGTQPVSAALLAAHAGDAEPSSRPGA